MKIWHRFFVGSMCAFALWALGACSPKIPSVATGTAISADQVAIQYETAGRGEPALVFVHCWTCNRGNWSPQAEYFAKHHQVVRLDLAGHGASGRERKDYAITAFAADVVTVVEKLGLKKVVLIGHSMGGQVVVEAAEQLGNRVIGVVGVDTFYTPFQIPKDAQKAKAMISSFIQPFENNYPETSAKFMRGFFAPGADPGLVEDIAKTAREADKGMALSAMRHVFAWYQANTPATLDALGPKLRNINADAKGEGKPLHPSVTLIPGAGHFAPQEKPVEFNRALERIIAEFTANSKDKRQ